MLMLRCVKAGHLRCFRHLIGNAFRASFTGRFSRHVQLGGDWEETQKSLLGLCVTWTRMPQDPPSGADEHCLGKAGGNVNLHKRDPPGS